jgi:hypothetical protein
MPVSDCMSDLELLSCLGPALGPLRFYEFTYGGKRRSAVSRVH